MLKKSNRIVKQKHSFDWRGGSRRDFRDYQSCCWQTACMCRNWLVMDLCREYKWEFLIRYKKESIPSIAAEYEKIPEKGKTEKVEFVNDIEYEGKALHVICFGRQLTKEDIFPVDKVAQTSN